MATERGDGDLVEGADALDEPRRGADEEDRTPEEQPDPLTVEDPEAGDVSAF